MPKTKSSTPGAAAGAARKRKVVFDVTAAEDPLSNKKPRVQDILFPSKEQLEQEEESFSKAALRKRTVQSIGTREETVFDIVQAQDQSPKDSSQSKKLGEEDEEDDPEPTPPQPTWWELLERLEIFKKEHQHCTVPSDHPLYSWVQTQRDLFPQPNSCLSTRQRAALAAIGIHMEHWNAMCRRLSEYAQNHGPIHNTIDIDPPLLEWVQEQRNPLHPLNSQQRALLQSIPGWDAEADRVRFETLRSRLAAHQDQYGQHPTLDTADARLVEWVQGLNFKTLPAYQRKALSPLLGWTTNDKKRARRRAEEPTEEEANSMLQKLQAFHRQHDHCNVSTHDDQELAEWIQSQRESYRTFQMTDRRRATLQLVGLDLTLTTTVQDWNAMYAYLQAFYSKFGHCNAPYPYDDHPALGEWIKEQRQAFHAQTLAEERKTKLDALEFLWYIQQPPREWRTKLDLLKQFRNQVGDCHVPSPYSDNPGLSEWVQTVRQDYVQHKLSEAQKQSLQVMGFLLERNSPAAQEKLWMDMYLRLVRYKRDHGNCSLPDDCSDDCHSQLSSWVRQQQQTASKLPKDQHQLLQDIGLVLEVNSKSPTRSPSKKTWEAQYAKLKAFYEVHGHSNLPKEKDPQLRGWVNTQRSQYRLQKMPQHRIDKLQAIQFVWSLERTWNDQYERLKQYKEQTGHCHVPHAWSKEDPALVQWVNRQRSLFKTGNLSKERCDLLEAIGFIWDASAFRGNKTSRTKAVFVASLTGKKSQRERFVVNNQKLQSQQAKLQANQEELNTQQAKLQENGETIEFLLHHLGKRLGGRRRR